MLFKRQHDQEIPELTFWRHPVVTDGLSEATNIDAPTAKDFEILADNIPTLCWIARADGYIFWYNRRWHEYCGTTAQAMEGWGWQTVHHADELPKVMQEWQKSIQTGAPFEMTFPLRGADGIFRRFLTRIVPVTNMQGQVIRWLGTNAEVEGQLTAEADLEASEARLRVLTDTMPQMIWSTLPDGHHDYYNARWYEFTGVPYGSTDGEGWAGMFHLDDQPNAWALWNHCLKTGEPYQIEYRLRRRDGAYRWTLGRALPVKDARGQITRWIGTCTDIDDAKRNAEQTELMGRELSHRIKNIFAVISGLIGLSSSHDPQGKMFGKHMAGRIAALGRAHNFARPHSPLSQPENGAKALHGLLEQLMEPYQHSDHKPYEILGNDLPISERCATPLALVIHELATNAVKYGALSVLDGKVHIQTSIEGDDLIIKWRETGGPLVYSSPSRTGFGTQLSDISIVGQLGGRLERHWYSGGLEVTMAVPKTYL
jgi:PAS domain S-box-containing protein